MPYVEPIRPEGAEGLLARVYEQRIRSAGRLWEIVAVQSRSPESLRDGMRLYGQIMFGESPLSRAQREMIAVVTSRVNECHY